MTTYLVRRFLQSVAFVLFSALVVYTALVMFMPNGPNQFYQRALEERRAAAAGRPEPDVGQRLPRTFDPSRTYWAISHLERRYKLDNPWPLNFLVWLFDPGYADRSEESLEGETPGGLDGGTLDAQAPPAIDVQIGDIRLRGAGILTGDFGTSEHYAEGLPVTELLSSRWLNTLLLVGSSILFSALVALPLGIIGAIKKHSAVDHFITFFSFTGISIPSFVLGLSFIILLAVLPSQWRSTNNWDWLPNLPAGSVYRGGEEGNWINRIYHLVLPVLTLSLPQIGWLSRHVRSSMLEVLGQDYIRTAWSKGLTARRVVLKHAFRNALLLIITVIGLALPGLMTGAVVVETVFAYSGMGQLYYVALGGCLQSQSLLARDIPPPCPPVGFIAPDYPIALALTLILVLVVALSNLLADILYVAADPRINLGAKQQS